MKQTIVSTAKELQEALLANVEEIILVGPNAASIVAGIEEAESKRSTAQGIGLFAGIVAIAAAPFTGGLSLGGLCLSGATVALSETVILAIIAGIVTISTEAMRQIRKYKVAKLSYNKVSFTRYKY